MNDIQNDVFFWFCDVTKQNAYGSVGYLFMEPLGEILAHYDNVYKIKKEPR